VGERQPDAVRVTAVDDQGHLSRFESRRLGRRRRARHGELQRRPAGSGGRGRSARRPSPVDPLQVRAALRRGCRALPLLDVGWHCVLDPEGAVKAANASVATYRLSVGKAGHGAGTVTGGAIECGLFCADRLDAGTLVTLRAAPLRGSRFLRWLGDCRGARPVCALRIAGPTKTIAVFAP
jgi:hypothetical protein